MDLQYVLVVVATVLAGIHTCRTDEMANFRGTKSKAVYCGRRLSETLSTVCKGNYNTLNKKSDIHEMGASRRPGYPSLSQHSLDYPYQSKANAASHHMSGFRRRKRRGVFNECCEKPCSLEELSQYCGGPSR
ncbi:LIRP [Tribolium castaneum]|nr:PREDICTED: LIRP [Tribolium castaneum]|eukprot:XP_001814181.1 PREDICTED: LIRP [Tribolium castaneum]